MKRFLLIGIGGVYNYGCEAIVRGTEKIIHNEFPDAEILYASHRVLDDSKRLYNANVKVIERKKFNRYSPKNIIRKLISFAGINWSPQMESLHLLKGVDAVFSIGGDIYTLGPKNTYNMSLPKFGDICEKLGKPYILWGASVGPFCENLKAQKDYTKHLLNISLISAREPATFNYLNKLGVCKNVVTCADPAYVVAPEIKAGVINKNRKLTIGINLSPLSVRFMKISEDEAVRSQTKTIEKLIKKFDANIILIPHVVCNFMEGDDDLRYLRKIKQSISDENQMSVKLVDSDPGFIGVKKELIKCDIVIAARMHCAINSLAACVPTILIAYSRKAVGMCHYVYGQEDWVVSINEFNKENHLENLVRSFDYKRPEIIHYLHKQIPEIQKECYKPLVRLNEIIK